MAAPTFVAVYEPSSNWGSTADGATRTTSTFDVLTNDRLIILGISENGTDFATPPTGGSLTYTLIESGGDIGAECEAAGWTTTVDSNKNMSISVINDGGTGARYWGFIVYHFRASDGFGPSEFDPGSTEAPSLAITTTQADSALVYINGDWNAVDGASRTWRTINSITPTSGNGLEKEYFRDS